MIYILVYDFYDFKQCGGGMCEPQNTSSFKTQTHFETLQINKLCLHCIASLMWTAFYIP